MRQRVDAVCFCFSFSSFLVGLSLRIRVLGIGFFFASTKITLLLFLSVFGKSSNSNSNMFQESPLGNSSDHASDSDSVELRDGDSSLTESPHRAALSTKRPTHCFVSSSSLNLFKRDNKHLTKDDEINKDAEKSNKKSDANSLLGNRVGSSAASPSGQHRLEALTDTMESSSLRRVLERKGRTPVPPKEYEATTYLSSGSASGSIPYPSHLFPHGFSSASRTSSDAHQPSQQKGLQGSNAMSAEHRFLERSGRSSSASRPSALLARQRREKRAGRGARDEAVSMGLFQEPQGFDRSKGSGSIKPSFPPQPPRFRLHHPHGFRLLQKTSVVERSLRHYFRLPEPPSDVVNAERWFVQDQLLWLEKEEREERRRLTRHMRGLTSTSPWSSGSSKGTGGIALDGFLLLSASNCENPEDVEVVTLQASHLEKTVPEDLSYFQNLFFLDLSENKLLLEDLLLLGGLETLHMTYNQIASLSALRSVVQWQELHREFILAKCNLDTEPFSASTVKNQNSAHVRNTNNPVEEELEDGIEGQANAANAFEILLPRLTVLNLSYNRIPSCQIGFLAYFPSLQRLDLSGNHLCCLPEDMSCLRNVSHLALECNNFDILCTSSSPTSAHSFSGEARNLFQSLSTMPSLVEVNLNRNNIQCVPPLSPVTTHSSCFYPALEVIGLTNNPIKKIDDVLSLASLHRTLRRVALSDTPLSKDPMESSTAQSVLDNAVGMLFQQRVRMDAREAAIEKGKKNAKKPPPQKNHPQAGIPSPQLIEIVDELWQKDSWSRLIPISEDLIDDSSTRRGSSPPTIGDTTVLPEKNGEEGRNGDNGCVASADDGGLRWDNASPIHMEEEEENHTTGNESGIAGGKLQVRNAAVAAATAAAAARRAEGDPASAVVGDTTSGSMSYKPRHGCSPTPHSVEQQAVQSHWDHPGASPPSSADFSKLMNSYLMTRNKTKGKTLSSSVPPPQHHQQRGRENSRMKKKNREDDLHDTSFSFTDSLLSRDNVVAYVRAHHVDLVLEGGHLKKKTTGEFLAGRRSTGAEVPPLITIPSYEEFMNIYQLAGGKRAQWKKQQARDRTRGIRRPTSLILLKPSSPTPTLPPSNEQHQQAVQSSEERGRNAAGKDEEEAMARATSFPNGGVSLPPPSHSFPYAEEDHVFLTAMGCPYEEADLVEKGAQLQREPGEGSDLSPLRKGSIGASSSSNGVSSESKNPTSILSSFGPKKSPISSLPSVQPVIPTNVHGAMRELRALLRKPLPSLPYSSSQLSLKRK